MANRRSVELVVFLLSGVLLAFVVNQLTLPPWLADIPNWFWWLLAIALAIFLFWLQGLGRTTPTEATTPREVLLKQVDREVNQRLTGSLHNEVLIQLGKQFDPTQVAPAIWQKEVLVHARSTDRTYSTSEPIADIFTHSEIDGRLLLLGNPGSGKTTTLVKLAEILVNQALADDTVPIPVLLNLSSWQPKQSLVEWMVGDLNLKYGVSRAAGQRWLQDRALLPLLDGLDEVAPNHQDACAQAINAYLTGEQQPLKAVVCCRAQDYARFETQLALNASLRILPLSRSMVQQYLQDVDQTELWESIRYSSELYELVRAPLFLSMMVLAAKRLSLERWQQCKTDADRRRFLFEAYLTEALQPDAKSRFYGKCQWKPQYPPSAVQAQAWLRWLATQLEQRGRTEFYIETLQPDWVDKADRWKYQLIGGLSFGLMGGLSFGLMGGLSFGLSFGLIGGLLSGLIGLLVGLIGGVLVGLIGGLRKISLVEAIRISMSHEARQGVLRSIRQQLLFGLSFGLSFGLILGLILGLIFGLLDGLIYGLIYGLILGLIYGLIFGPIFGLLFGLLFGLFFGLIGGLLFGLRADVLNKTHPNQGIWDSFRNLWIVSVMGSPAGVALYTLFTLAANLAMGEPVSAIFSLETLIYGVGMTALAGIIAGGGLACIQHASLRFVLWRQGVAPWNYARFLQYMAERRVMQQVGGGFRFLHDLLRKHLAEGEF